MKGLAPRRTTDGPRSWVVMLESTARAVARLQRKKRELRHRLREVEDELRLRRRELRKLAGAMVAERSPETPPLREFGESQYD